MTSCHRITTLTASIVLVTTAAIAQVRDAPAVPARDATKTTAGTSSIVGTILTDADPARPVRRATVLLISPGTDGRTAVSDDSGRFVFSALPEGRYNMIVSKRGWTRMNYGATAPGRPGTPIQVAAGQRATVTMRMPRPAVITGTVLDENGQAPAGVSMIVMQYRYDSGERHLARVGGSSSGPDERGQYRIFGLPPGEYYIVASGTRDVFGAGSDLHLTSDVDVQQATSAIEGGPAVPIANVPQRTVGSAPMYYPGTPSIAQATPITVHAGEERTGVDFVTQYSTTARIDGTVTGLDGAPATGAVVNLITTDPNVVSLGFEAMRRSTTDASGTFRFAGIAPGNYILFARSGRPAAWANADLDIHGDDIHGVALAMQETLTVSGTVRFDGTGGQAPAFTAVRVALQPLGAAGGVTVASATSAIADASGHFSIAGVTPGQYRLSGFVMGGRGPATWVMKAASLAGQDSLDAVVDVRSSISDGLLTLTDQVSELSGRAAPNAFVIVFSTNPAHWAPPARHTLWGRVAADGTFTIRNIPPGDYHVVAVTDAEPGQWLDPGYLQALVPSARHVTIAEGEKKTVDIGGGS